MLVVELLHFGWRDLDVAADFLLNDALRNELVLDVVLEIFPVDALLFGLSLELFQVLCSGLLADLVEPLDDVSVDADAEVLAFLDEKLLIDEVAELVFLALGDDLVGIGIAGLLYLVGNLLFGAAQVGARDDRVVDSRDNLFDDRLVGTVGGS